MHRWQRTKGQRDEFTTTDWSMKMFLRVTRSMCNRSRGKTIVLREQIQRERERIYPFKYFNISRVYYSSSLFVKVKGTDVQSHAHVVPVKNRMALLNWQRANLSLAILATNRLSANHCYVVHPETSEKEKIEKYSTDWGIQLVFVLHDNDHTPVSLSKTEYCE